MAGKIKQLGQRASLSVTIMCSMDWLKVTVSATSSTENRHIFHDELSLGWSCPPTSLHTYEYDFVYLTSECGIRTEEIFSEHLLCFHTEIYFRPRDMHSNPLKTPLVCFASRKTFPNMSSLSAFCSSVLFYFFSFRKSVWILPVSKEDEIKLEPSPFMVDFKATDEELGLLSCSQNNAPYG
ncbi:oocyte-secreted protein 2 [Erinaceus europaeus]|uniref:Oocyte-secreted protein 2 n=1 Tax=Erinaceus europaeus TaxID=9365 RepID=A0ABM3W556_ERIEU|nr:oocyte-secreted protein 2 [Erinaceus europaeus]